MSEREAAANVIRFLQRPIQHILDNPKLTDLYINGSGPGQAFVDVGRGIEQITLPYTDKDLDNLAHYAAAYTEQEISASYPIASTTLPGGERTQIIIPPAVGQNRTSFSIRKPQQHTATPQELEDNGVFDGTEDASQAVSTRDELMTQYLKEGKIRLLLERAISIRKNIVFAGPLGSGKTYDLRAMTHAIPLGTRIITIEDADEMINLPHANIVHLFYSKGGQSVADVTAEKLVEATKRMGMGCVLNQELRDDAAHSFMDVLDSGCHGMTTTHAGSAKETRGRIRWLIKKHATGTNLKNDELDAMLHRAIDVIVYCVRDGEKRRIKEILYDPEAKQQAMEAV